MTYQEKKSVVRIITYTLFMAVYAIIVINKFNNGDFDQLSEMRFWATIILISVPIQVAVAIIVEIVINIVAEISMEIKGTERDDIDVVDERDRLIELKTMRISMVFFAIGFMIALGTQVFDFSIHVFFIVIVSFGFVSELIGETLKIHFYRNGV